MIRLLFSRIGLYLAGALAVIGAALGLYSKGKRDAKAKTALEAAEAYAKTRKAMDDVEVVSDDPAVLRDWMRERGKQ